MLIYITYFPFFLKKVFRSTILVLGYSIVKEDLPIMHIEMVSIFRSTRNNNNIHIFIIPLVVPLFYFSNIQCFHFLI